MELAILILVGLIVTGFGGLLFLHVLGDEVQHWGTILLTIWTRYQSWSLHFEQRRISILHHLDSMSIVRKLYRTSFGDRMDNERTHDQKALKTAEKIRAIEIMEADNHGVQHL